MIHHLKTAGSEDNDFSQYHMNVEHKKEFQSGYYI